MNENPSGTYLDQVRDIFVEARLVPIELAAEIPQLDLDADEIDTLAKLRVAGWHAFRREARGAEAWVTLAHLTNDSIGLQTVRRNGDAIADETWFAFDAAGVAALAVALRS